MDGTGSPYVKWDKLGTEGKLCDLTHMWNLKKIDFMKAESGFMNGGYQG